MRLPLSILFFVLGLFVFPATALAQTITINQETSLPRLNKDGSAAQKRAITLNPEGVSYQDCLDDQRIRFPIVLAGFEGNASFEVWAGLGGADCKVQTNRTGINAICWQLITGIPLQTNTLVDIPVRKIMSGAPPFRPAEPVSDASVCGRIDLAQISVQFLYFKPGQLATPAVHKDLQVTVDTVGPSPPSGMRTLPGNGRITVQWDNISGEGGVSVLTGVRVYCDRGESTPITIQTEAGTSLVCDDAGTDDAGDATVDASCVEVENEGGTTTVQTDCGSGAFVAAANERIVPDAQFDAKFLCGSIFGNSGTSVIADSLAGAPLANGSKYAVAVAATDAYGNNGPLSDPICETPEQTTDFWENYRKAGGDGGGGFCNVSSPGTPVGSVIALGLVVAVALSSLRRRSRS